MLNLGLRVLIEKISLHFFLLAVECVDVGLEIDGVGVFIAWLAKGD